MTPETIWILVMVVVLFGGILSGSPVMLVLAGAPTLVALAASLTDHFDLVFFQAVPQRVFGVMENTLLIAVPLFILMGVLLAQTGQAERMLKSVNKLFGGSQSSLALSVVMVSGLIAASTGIIGATIVMLGAISLPSLLKAGVDRRTSSGLICASGTLGQIIPPSIILILLGDQVSNAYIEAQQNAGNFAPDPVTVSDLFAGALLPGLLLVALYSLYLWFRLRGKASTQTTKHEPDLTVWQLVKDVFPTLGLILAVLGGILIGVATPTEAAGVGVAGTMIIAAFHLGGRASRIAQATGLLAIVLLILKQSALFGLDFEAGTVAMTPASILSIIMVALLVLGMAAICYELAKGGLLLPALTETLLVSGMVFGIIIAASILALVFRGLNGDELVAHFFDHIPGGEVGMLVFTMLVIFCLGFVLEFVEIIFIVIPIVGPIILQGDIDPVWFAILIAMNLQTSFLTPPFGFALFYFRSVAPPEISTADIYWSVVPFVAIQIAAIFLLALFPALATWLPDVLF